ncbi:uncharacterized protein LOC132752025 [Ruditapes philippinarum]|uniref:uncharacterized protein LOC132752025 n=1 Tax=Ruditapes philippinarum TaxID=129788 RepID=UPI00295C2C82|nr:uncharacterized protein LOC132752025 [Ruditapes philippinarum]
MNYWCPFLLSAATLIYVHCVSSVESEKNKDKNVAGTHTSYLVEYPLQNSAAKPKQKRDTSKNIASGKLTISSASSPINSKAKKKKSSKNTKYKSLKQMKVVIMKVKRPILKQKEFRRKLKRRGWKYRTHYGRKLKSHIGRTRKKHGGKLENIIKMLATHYGKKLKSQGSLYNILHGQKFKSHNWVLKSHHGKKLKSQDRMMDSPSLMKDIDKNSMKQKQKVKQIKSRNRKNEIKQRNKLKSIQKRMKNILSDLKAITPKLYKISENHSNNVNNVNIPSKTLHSRGLSKLKNVNRTDDAGNITKPSALLRLRNVNMTGIVPAGNVSSQNYVKSPNVIRAHIVDESTSGLSDKTLLVGVLVGAGFSLFIFILCCVLYKALLYYRARRLAFINGDTDSLKTSHMQIELTKKMPKKNGSNQYIVSIFGKKFPRLGKKDIELDSSSEEEEVFNRSIIDNNNNSYGNSPSSTPISSANKNESKEAAFTMMNH